MITRRTLLGSLPAVGIGSCCRTHLRRAGQAAARRISEGRADPAGGEAESQPGNAAQPARHRGAVDRIPVRPTDAGSDARQRHRYRRCRRHAAGIRPGGARRSAVHRRAARRRSGDPGACRLHAANAAGSEGQEGRLRSRFQRAQPDARRVGEGRAELRRHPADLSRPRRCRRGVRARRDRCLDHLGPVLRAVRDAARRARAGEVDRHHRAELVLHGAAAAMSRPIRRSPPSSSPSSPRIAEMGARRTVRNSRHRWRRRPACRWTPCSARWIAPRSRCCRWTTNSPAASRRWRTASARSA